MTNDVTTPWEAKRTDETRQVEDVLRNGGFQQADAYRYNSASIRVRVIDSTFAEKSIDQRDEIVERHLKKLPERTQADIVNLLTFAPQELTSSDAVSTAYILNLEFESPSPSML